MHVHSEGPQRGWGRPAGAQRALGLALGLTLGFTIVEAAGAWLAGSLALASDAGHMLADVFALGLSLGAIRFAARPADAVKTYGYYRLEILAALVNGVLLGVVAVSIFHEAAGRLWDPRPVHTRLMLAVAAAGLAVNLLAAWLLHRSGPGRSLNLRGAYLHVASDALSSVGVLAGGLLIAWTGETRIDALVGLLIGGAILWSAQRLVRESVDVLLEAMPRGLHSLEVSRTIGETPGVEAVHDLHIWSLTTGIEALSAHVRVPQAALPQADRILGDINAALRARYGIEHTTIQIESEAGDHACVAHD